MNEISLRESKSLKGIAIIMVVISHVVPIYGLNFVNILGAVGVALFLFLSGYGLERSFEKKGLKDYFSKKLMKVYIPYIIAILLFLLWAVCIGIHTPIVTALKYCVLIELPQGSYWYLIILSFYYVVFYFACKIENKYIQLVVLLLSSFVLIATKDFNRGYLWQFATFPGGVFYARMNSLQLENRNKKLAESLLVIILSVSGLLKKIPMVESNELGFFDTILQIIIVYSFGALMIFLRAFLNRKIFIWIGGISYAIYLSHCIPLDWLMKNGGLKNLFIYLTVVCFCTLIIELFNVCVLVRRKRV